jgi:hypothetical protein
MPKATVTASKEINVLKTDTKVNTELTTYYPDITGDDHTYQVEDPEDGFTSFINRIDARKVRARSRIFPEDSN